MKSLRTLNWRLRSTRTSLAQLSHLKRIRDRFSRQPRESLQKHLYWTLLLSQHIQATRIMHSRAIFANTIQLFNLGKLLQTEYRALKVWRKQRTWRQKSRRQNAAKKFLTKKSKLTKSNDLWRSNEFPLTRMKTNWCNSSSSSSSQLKKLRQASASILLTSCLPLTKSKSKNYCQSQFQQEPP